MPRRHCQASQLIFPKPLPGNQAFLSSFRINQAYGKCEEYSIINGLQRLIQFLFKV